MVCQICGSDSNLTRHHMLSQTKLYRRLYGQLLDDPRNIMIICLDCHLTEPIPKLTETEFCDLLQITPRSKEAKAIAERNAYFLTRKRHLIF